MLLTSRLSSLKWLTYSAEAQDLPPMDMAERVELAVTHTPGDSEFDANLWTPLLVFFREL
jgi:hypothetical protein